MTSSLLSEKIIDFLVGTFYWFQTLAKPQEFLYSANGITFSLRKNTSDLFVVQETLSMDTYQIKPHGIVVDIGANIGAFTLYAAKRAKYAYAFEPESSNYQQLQKNVRLNTFSNIHTFKKAVGGFNKQITLYKAHANRGHSSTALQVSTKTEQVEMISLQDAFNLCSIQKVDVLKIDIEGGEYELIENIPESLFSKIDSITMEFHRVPGKIYHDLVRKLQQAGYTVSVKRKLYEYAIGTGILVAQKP